VIAAANYEVIDNRHPKFSVPFNAIDIRTFKPSEDPRIKFPSLQEKDFNYKNFDVSWKPQTHKKFLEMGETPEGLKKFEAGHRGLKLSESPVIGKACTYFATTELFELLAKMPLDQRLCDLRLVENARDMALAIRASAAEPTFYPVVTEDEPEKLMVGTELGSLGNSTERRYWGGYIMPMVSQDLRRSLPHLTVMGTGWYDVMANIAKLFVALVLVDPNECGKRGEYWADFVATPSEEMKKSIFGARLSIEREFNIGVEVTNQCIDRELNGAKPCVPAGASPSFFDAAPNALSPIQYGVGDPLPRARGIKHLL
jgi:hypothetical protein